MPSRPEAREFLRQVGQQADSQIELAEAALMLAVLDRPSGDLDSYRRHLGQLAEDVAARHAGFDDHVAARTAALRETLVNRYGYQGDTQTYEDLQNANLMSVIDRRRGLPVALGILFLHVARIRGWDMVGLNFPGHFLVRLEAAGERIIIDPFRRGLECSAVDLRDLLKATAGAAAELEPEHYAPVDNRSILLRLQNNIKKRVRDAGEHRRAALVLEGMLAIAPEIADLWREAAEMRTELGELKYALQALDRFLLLSDDSQRGEAMALRRNLATKIN